ncbi:MAG: membrane dipeptidase [Planctomycetes bacterium]|nr:membrane dipeptidase [Planctomycetota bacterium]
MSLHEDAIVVDLHADTLIPMRVTGYRFGVRHRNPFLQKLGFYHCDLPRFRAAGITGQFFGLVTFPYPERGCAAACFRQIELLRREPGLLFARTAGDIRRARREGKLAALFGIEGGHNLEGRIENVRAFHEAGVRYLGLVHFTRNELCTPSGGVGSDRDAPLTDFGRTVIAEMNRLGMMVDLAHVARAAFLEAARLSTRPVIVSHTGIDAAHPLWRNIDDEQIRAVAEKDGVVGIIFAWRYLGRRRGGVEMLAPHFEHVRRLVGARHLALGSDYDGAVAPLRGLESVSGLPAVTKLLQDLRWSEEEIRGVLGENVLRVMGEHSAD